MAHTFSGARWTSQIKGSGEIQTTGRAAPKPMSQSHGPGDSIVHMWEGAGYCRSSVCLVHSYGRKALGDQQQDYARPQIHSSDW